MIMEDDLVFILWRFCVVKMGVRTRVFHDASVLVGGDFDGCVESNQSRQFVLLNKQKFV